MSAELNVEPGGGIITPSPVTTPVPIPTFAAQVAALPAEMRDHPAMSKFSSLEQLSKEHINATAMIGRKGYVTPREGDLADTKRFMTELGWPESPDSYSTGEYVVPENLGWDDDFKTGINAAFHQAGLTEEQYKKALPACAAVFEAQQNAMVEYNMHDQQQKMSALKSEMGAAFESKLNAGTRALSGIYGDNADRIMKLVLADGTLLGNDVDFVRGLMEIGENSYVGDHLVDGDGVKVQGIMTPGAALAEIKRLKGDEKFVKSYTTRNDIGHAEANSLMNRLFEQAYPGG